MVVLDRENIYFQAEHILKNYAWGNLSLENTYNITAYIPIEFSEDVISRPILSNFDRLLHIRKCIFHLHDADYENLTEADKKKILIQIKNMELLQPVLEHYCAYLRLCQKTDILQSLHVWEEKLSSIIFQQIKMNAWMVRELSESDIKEEETQKQLYLSKRNVDNVMEKLRQTDQYGKTNIRTN